METSENVFSKAANTRPYVDQAAAQTHDAIDKAYEAARPAIGRVASSAHGAVDRIAGAATQAAETLEEKGGQIRDAQARLVDDCSAYVREHPFASMGVLVAVGFLLGKLTSFR